MPEDEPTKGDMRVGVSVFVYDGDRWVEDKEKSRAMLKFVQGGVEGARREWGMTPNGQ